jgi:hypothetical protein
MEESQVDIMSTKRQQEFKNHVYSFSTRKRKRNTEFKRKLRGNSNCREREAQQARRRYKQKQEQLRTLHEQIRCQQEIIKLNQQKIEFMSFCVYELEATSNLASLEAATTKASLDRLKMELQQAKTKSNQSRWKEFTERNSHSPLLKNLIKFNTKISRYFWKLSLLNSNYSIQEAVIIIECQTDLKKFP